MYQVVFSANATFSPSVALRNASVMSPPLASILARRNLPAGFDWKARTTGSLRRRAFHVALSTPGNGPLTFWSATALTITGSAAQPAMTFFCRSSSAWMADVISNVAWAAVAATTIETPATKPTRNRRSSSSSSVARPCTAQCDQPGHVQDQRDATVAQNRGSSHSGDLLKVGFETLDHDRLLAEQLIDEQRHVASLVLDQNHDSLRGILDRRP